MLPYREFCGRKIVSLRKGEEAIILMFLLLRQNDFKKNGP